MKKVTVLLSIIIVVLNVLPATAQSIHELPVWLGAKKFAINQQMQHMDGTGVVVKAPKQNSQGVITPSSLEIYIALDNDQIIPVRPDYILPEPGGTMQTMDWGIFDQPTAKGPDGMLYYTAPIIVHFHRYYAEENGTYRLVQYVTL